MQRKEIEIIAGTDLNAVAQVEQEYYNVLKILVDPELEPLKTRIYMLYQNLTQQLEGQENQIRKCKMNKADIDNCLSRIATCNKIIQEEAIQTDNIKKDLDKIQAETEQLRRRQNDDRDAIAAHKLQISILEKEREKGLEDIQIKQENDENQLKKQLDEQTKIRDELKTKEESLRAQHRYSMEEITILHDKNRETATRIDQLRQKIREIEGRDQLEKKNSDQKKDDLNRAKVEKDNLREQKKVLDAAISELEKEIQITSETLKNEKKSKDEQLRAKTLLEKQKEQIEKEYVRKVEQVSKQRVIFEEKLNEVSILKSNNTKLRDRIEEANAQKALAQHKLNEITTNVEEIERKKEELLSAKIIHTEELKSLLAKREEAKSRIDELFSKRLEKDKLYKQSESREKELTQEQIEEHNRYKKIFNQKASYQSEQQKLMRIFDQIKREQEKYALQASHSQTRYLQILEESKVKNIEINTLKKANQEAESKCKHQQNLYEAVRSDRNLYSKQFIKRKSEISQLNKKYKRMTREVDQLREEIKNKDQELVELDKESKKVEAENSKINADIGRSHSQILSTQEVIVNQEAHVGHLKKIIQEAQAQKAKQQKDYDMVRNQRDILGTQLIKREQELAVLYEKIKLANSSQSKTETYKKERDMEFKQLRKRLAVLRNEHISIEEQARCLDDLKAQVNFKSKELLSQQAKVKALEDELENPLNVHRWRKLEATDQENYQRILKIQTLQRRLIAKTEEVEAKEGLIREKEKLFLELKSILSRQPGSQIHEQLVKYKETLKEKTAQMKKMKKELEDAHQEMWAGKFEVDRIKSAMQKMKDEYFELRDASEKEVMQERRAEMEAANFGIVPMQQPIEISTVKK